jgi:hypothetical protein
MEDEDMSHDAAPPSTFMPDMMEEYDNTEAGSQTATEQCSHPVATMSSGDVRAGVPYEQRRIRVSGAIGPRLRERSESLNQRMADANFFNRFPDDFDEDDMKLPTGSEK